MLCRTIDSTVRRPDISVFLNERLARIELDKVSAPFAPDIAIEVLSPSEGATTVRRKVREYLAAGSQEVWLLDYSSGEILVHTSGGIRVLQGNDVLETPVLPGFKGTVTDLLAG